ncbi:MAG: nuclear transport factor 2 family protein [Propionibacterium sp.]|nr:nuclear transport factor 2 family protein [Propionibacterium sp.]
MSDPNEARLRDIEDRLELLNLEGAYSRTFDAKDGDAWSALFTPDGIYQSRTAPGETPKNFVRGTEELRAFCSNAEFTGIHMMHAPEFTIDGDTATARVHLEFNGWYENAPGSTRLRMVGHYDVAYERMDGAWRIKRRVTSTYSRVLDSTFGHPSGSGLDDPIPGD